MQMLSEVSVKEKPSFIVRTVVLIYSGGGGGCLFLSPFPPHLDLKLLTHQFSFSISLQSTAVCLLGWRVYSTFYFFFF